MFIFMSVNSPGIIFPLASIPLATTFGSCCSLGSENTSTIIGNNFVSLKTRFNTVSISLLFFIEKYLNPKTFESKSNLGIDTPDDISDATRFPLKKEFCALS